MRASSSRRHVFILQIESGKHRSGGRCVLDFASFAARAPGPVWALYTCRAARQTPSVRPPSLPHTLHTLEPSHPHTLTPSHPHTLTPSHPYTLARLRAYVNGFSCVVLILQVLPCLAMTIDEKLRSLADLTNRDLVDLISASAHAHAHAHARAVKPCNRATVQRRPDGRLPWFCLGCLGCANFGTRATTATWAVVLVALAWYAQPSERSRPLPLPLPWPFPPTAHVALTRSTHSGTA